MAFVRLNKRHRSMLSYVMLCFEPQCFDYDFLADFDLNQKLSSNPNTGYQQNSLNCPPPLTCNVRFLLKKFQYVYLHRDNDQRLGPNLISWWYSYSNMPTFKQFGKKNHPQLLELSLLRPGGSFNLQLRFDFN